MRLGWSAGLEQLPQHDAHDPRIYGLSGPSPLFPAASLDLEQVEGQAALGGITIPSPWDQLLGIKATAPRRVQQEAQAKACAQAMALSDEERSEAVAQVVMDVCQRIQARLPAFVEGLRAMENRA